MEHRIARAGGHRSDDEARALNARIADLSKLLEAVNSQHAMLTAQVWLQAAGCAAMVRHAACQLDSLPYRNGSMLLSHSTDTELQGPCLCKLQP
jgi:hypothetical protein